MHLTKHGFHFKIFVAHESLYSNQHGELFRLMKDGICIPLFKEMCDSMNGHGDPEPKS